MMYCEHCGIKIDCHAENCPLCHKPIKEKDEGLSRAYPTAKIKRIRPDNFSLIYWIFAIAVMVACVTVNLVYNDSFLWSVIVVVSLIYVYYCLRFTLIAQMNFNGIIFGQTIALTSLFIAVRLIVGGNHFIFITWLPIVYLLSEVLLCAYIAYNKKEARKKFMSLVVMGILGIIPVCAAYGFDISVKWPSIVVSALSVGIVFVTLFIARKHVLGELKRYFHR